MVRLRNISLFSQCKWVEERYFRYVNLILTNVVIRIEWWLVFFFLCQKYGLLIDFHYFICKFGPCYKSNSKKIERLEKSCQLLYPYKAWNYEQIIWKNPKLSPEKNDTESNFYLSTLHGKSKCAVCVCCVMNKKQRVLMWGRAGAERSVMRPQPAGTATNWMLPNLGLQLQ